MISLRPYQQDGLTALRATVKTYRSVCYCLPCGGGKGTVVSAMVHGSGERGKYVIFAVRGLALVHDMSRRITRLGIRHGVLMGGSRREDALVQVASIDTLHRMAVKPRADLIILDEARTFLCATGLRVLADYPDALIVGMDATPARLDGTGLKAIFNHLVMGPDEQALIDMGYLVPSIPIGIPDPPDLTGVKKTGGDFNQKQLAAVCNKVKLVGDIVGHWLKLASGRKTIAFGVNQAHARHIADSFLAAGIEWAYVDANTPDAEREAIYDRLDNGTLMGISNVLIAGIGWDHPVVSCIIAARPTASLTLWRQMMGRGSRPYPGKKDFLILDHASNVMRHYPYGFFETPPGWTLDGIAADTSTDAGEAALRISMCKSPVRVPLTGIPASFTGPVSPDGKWLLPSYHTFVSGPALCPYCGIPLSIPRKITTAAGQLKDLSAAREAARLLSPADNEAKIRAESGRKAAYLDMVRMGKERGYKPGFPGMQFKARYGFWPPKGWKQEVSEIVGA